MSIPDTLPMEHVLAEPAPRSHLVTFYHDDADVERSLTRYLKEGLRRQEQLLLIAAADRWERVSDALRDDGIQLDTLETAGRLVVLDVHEALAGIMVDGMPDQARFQEVVGGAYQRLPTRTAPRLRAYGEMVDVLWQAGDVAAAVRLEAYWNAFIAQHALTLLCAYRTSLLDASAPTAAMEQVCTAHSHAFLVEGRSRLDAAVRRAVTEVLGARHSDALLPLIRANVWKNGSLGEAERTIFWLRRNLPSHLDAVLHRTRHHVTEMPEDHP